MNSERGMVLITVLWIVLILSLVAFSLSAAVRVEMRAAQSDFDSERAFLMAKGAVETVYQNVIVRHQGFPEKSRIQTKDGEYIFSYDSGEARVNFDSSARQIDVNASSDKLLASMFDSLGLDSETRNRLVDSIADWRDSDDVPHPYGTEFNDYPQSPNPLQRLPRNQAFESVDDLLLVKNMTPEIFYGRLTVDPLTKEYRRFPGVRDLVTVTSGRGSVDINSASPDVLMALPQMTLELSQMIIAEREQKRFGNSDDLIQRLPNMFGRDTLDYLSFDAGPLTTLVARATVQPSGTSRSVRILFSRIQKPATVRTIAAGGTLYFVRQPAPPEEI